MGNTMSQISSCSNSNLPGETAGNKSLQCRVLGMGGTKEKGELSLPEEVTEGLHRDSK